MQNRNTRARQTSSNINTRGNNNNRRGGSNPIYTNPLFALAVVLVLVGLIIVLLVAKNGCSGSVSSDYYAQGVYINGSSMSSFTHSEGERQVRAWANSILSKKYSFTFTDPESNQIYTWEFSPTMVSASMNVDEVLSKAWALGHSGSRSDQSKVQQDLRQNQQNLIIELSYDESKLDAFIDSVYYDGSIYIQPVDAQIVLTATKPEVLTASRDGRELNRHVFKLELECLMENGMISASLLKGGLNELLQEGTISIETYDASLSYLSRVGSDTTAFELPVEITTPSVSSDLAENGLRLIVEYSTDLSESSSDRCSNVRTALDNFNGFEVKPGDTVSFNQIVGERTLLMGYKEATVYYGDTVTQGVGGGVCQASSTLYGAVLKAGMDIIERDHHSLIVNYCEASMDAAVSDKQDFVFQNNTDYTIYIYTKVVNKVEATVYIYGNRPDYDIKLVSTIVQNNIKNSATDIRIDTTGEIAYYKTDLIRVKEGKLGRKSKLERLYYDWENGSLVKVELISEDYYSGERDIYYQGIH